MYINNHFVVKEEGINHCLILRGQCLETLEHFNWLFEVKDLGWKGVPFPNSPGEETSDDGICGNVEHRAPCQPHAFDRYK